MAKNSWIPLNRSSDGGAWSAFCGGSIEVVPPVPQDDGTVVPGYTLLDDCPRCLDEFARAALSGMLASGGSWDSRTVVDAYRLASLMMTTRPQTEDDMNKLQRFAIEHPLARAMPIFDGFKRLDGQWSIILTVNK